MAGLERNMAGEGGAEVPQNNITNESAPGTGEVNPLDKSPIKSLTPKEFNILSKRYTPEQLQDIEARLTPEEFRVGADAVLEGIRAEEAEKNRVQSSEIPGISPSVAAVRQAGYVVPEIVGQVPESVKLAGEVRNELIDIEGPRGPRPPEMDDKEWETSPERGRGIVKEIIRLETTLPYTERYLVTRGLMSDPKYGNTEKIYKENGIYLNQLYEDLQDYTRAVRRIRNDRNHTDPWNPINVYRNIKEAFGRIVRGESSTIAQQTGIGQVRERGERPPVLPTESLDALFEKYKTNNVDAVEGDMASYFQEARALGLLDRADAIFASTYRQIIQAQGAIPDDQVEEMLEKNTELAKRTIERALFAHRTNPAVANPNLQNIAEAYTTRTAHIFELVLSGENYTPIEGECRFNEEEESDDEDTKVYWEPGHWQKTYEITAQNIRQFRIAMGSFISKITGGALGKSPDELYEHFNNFTEKFAQTAIARGMPQKFIEGSRRLLQGHGFVFGGDYSFETYNMRSANQFLMAMALHEGPDRWVQLARSGNGAVGAYLWKFDYDPRITLMHNPGGSRGQLLNDTVTQHYLHNQIKNILIEEGMGVVMKDYHPDIDKGRMLEVEDIVKVPEEFIEIQGKLGASTDLSGLSEEERKVYDDVQSKIQEAQEIVEQSRVFIGIQNKLQAGTSFDALSSDERNNYLAALHILRNDDMQKSNSDRIGIHQPVEEFKGLYEGFDRGDAHIVNYERYKTLNKQELKWLSPELRKSIQIGKVQSLLRGGNEGKSRDQLIDVIKGLRAAEQLTDKEVAVWIDAYDQSAANFATAFQMVGATGEKARRGGGVFFIDRKDEHGRRFVDNMPVYSAEMFVQYAENITKIAYSNESDVWAKEGLDAFFAKNNYYIEITNEKGQREKLTTKAAYRAYKVGMARKDANDQIKTNGFEAKLKAPKLLFNIDENSPNFGDVIGLDGNQTEDIDFDTATDPENPLNKWLNNTYLSYQPENRHQVTNPDVLKAARRLRIKLLRPDLAEKLDQDELNKDQFENLAGIAFVLDPTLTRIASLKDSDMPEGMSAQQAEIILFDAAVEASNYGHWRITRELNAEFISKDGDPFKMRTGYNLEDYSGIARFIIRMRQFVASNPKRFSRRYAAEIANLPLNVSSMPDQWGQPGVLGAIEMFADPIGEMSDQREAGQFAITKWVEQMKIGNMIYDALVGHVDSEKGFSIEGLFEKPTNNAEKVGQIQDILGVLDSNDKGKSFDMNAELQFMNLVLESFDRLWTILKLVRTMESDTRNAQGALDLEKTEVFVNGKFNTAIAKDTNTGSSRHTERQFFDAYIKWLTEGQGVEAYPGEAQWYEKLLGKTILDPKHEMTRAQWIFNKMAR